MKKIIILLVCTIGFFGCKKTEKKSNNETRESVTTPAFSADSAYQYIQDQIDFGARVPNTAEHVACAEYLVHKLMEFGAEVTEQRADLEAFDGTILKAVNIIGSYQPENKMRVALFSHWDSRPWADNDPSPANRTTPVMGANDGASSVGVLLEIARQINMQQPQIGIDIILFDAEDYGAPEHLASVRTQDSWCLGSQYWAKNPHTDGYHARYGILLDMVGAPNATFYREQISEYYASHVINKVWMKARTLGFDNYFINKQGAAITDDHLYVNRHISIPTIDIIQYNLDSSTSFGHYWHTVNDTMDNIDKNTLHAVGTTLLHVIYNEK